MNFFVVVVMVVLEEVMIAEAVLREGKRCLFQDGNVQVRMEVFS